MVGGGKVLVKGFKQMPFAQRPGEAYELFGRFVGATITGSYVEGALEFQLPLQYIQITKTILCCTLYCC